MAKRRANTAQLRRSNDLVKAAVDRIQEHVRFPGRPPKYHAAFPRLAEKMAELGATLPQLADVFGVKPSTVSGWKRDYPEFNSAITRGRGRADAEVEKALYSRATGYSHRAVKIFFNDGRPVFTPYVKHYPPDTGAAILWLRNRQPTEWRTKVVANSLATDDARRLLREQLAANEKSTSGKS